VLITAHRRENFGEPFLRICEAFAFLAKKHSEIDWIYPVHPNPNVNKVAHNRLSEFHNIKLCKPLDYLNLVDTLKRCMFVITDSGGLQEEAPALGKPVLVLRDETERPEAVELGVVKLVGTDPSVIINYCTKLIEDPSFYQSMAKSGSPYGDGNASSRIADILTRTSS